MKEVNNQSLRNFEIGSQENMNVPVWNIIGFQRRDKQNSQNVKNDRFFRMPVTSAQCKIGREKIPDAAILLNYDDDDYSQGYGHVKEAFRALPKNDFLQA